ncbi:UNVERIFIED_CONTAM: Adhesion G protein-coupled receptor B3 [Gekko kuhli]
MTDKRSILFQILFAVFDSLQGFVIVMVHCILRREVQDAFRCRLRNCQDPINADSSSSFPNGHAQIMTDFEKDVDIACRSVLHKDIGPCRAATITGTLSRISLNDDEEEKPANPEGMSYSTLPGNIISKVIIQQSGGMHMPMSMSELANQCLKKDNTELRRTVYLCTDDNLRGADMDVVHPQDRLMESDYIVMPRGSVSTQPSLKDDSKLNIGMDTLPHERLFNYKVNPEFSMNPSVMDQFSMSLDQHLTTQEHMQNLPFEPRTAVKNFMASEMDDSTGLARSETGSTISMSSLEVSDTENKCMRDTVVGRGVWSSVGRGCLASSAYKPRPESHLPARQSHAAVDCI